MLDFKNKKVLIFGLGRYRGGSGVSAARFFVRHGARVTVTDQKTARELGETVQILKRENRKQKTENRIVFHLGGHRLSDIRAADFVIRNPGVPNDSPYLKAARRLKIPVMTDVSIFMQLCPCPILGVTGTRGKSTTTALLGEMVRRANQKTFIGGNIQRSPLNFLDKLDESSIVVLELSSWLLESLVDIKKSPGGAIITNIYPDHLNIHRSLREYVAAKENIVRFQKPGDIAVLNYDDVTIRRRASHFYAVQHESGNGTVWFSMKPLPKVVHGACVKSGWITVGSKRVIPVKHCALAGDHNVANALAATALACAVGVPVQKIVAALKTFRGLPNRQEIVRVHRGVTWVNDTTATSPEAVIAALERFSNSLRTTYYLLPTRRVVLIAGGTDKNFRPAQFVALARAMRKYCKAVILLPGTATNKLKKYLGTRYYVLGSQTMREAIRQAQRISERGDIVLLSPGAASFGLFKNEFDRGEQFVNLVRAL